METRKQHSRAIVSSQEEKELGSALRKQGFKYYILYRLMIDTGISLNTALSLVVSDLKDKDCLFLHNHPNALEEGYIVHLSNPVKKELTLYLEDKPLTSYVFCAQDNVTPLGPTTFRRTLMDCAEKCDMKNITPLSLKKTYMYHRYLKCGNVTTIRKELSLPSNRHVYEYFGLAPKSIPEEKVDFSFLREKMFQPNYFVTIKRTSDETNALIKTCLSQKQMPNASCQKLYTHLEKYLQDMKELAAILDSIKQ